MAVQGWPSSSLGMVTVVGSIAVFGILAPRGEVRASFPLAVLALQGQHPCTPPLGGDPRPLRCHEVSWRIVKIAQCLPADGVIGVENPVEHRHGLRLTSLSVARVREFLTTRAIRTGKLLRHSLCGPPAPV